MLRRYAIPCAVIVVVALAIAAIAYKVARVDYTGTCTFTFSLPVTSQSSASDVLTFESERAANEIAQAGRADIYSGPAAAVGIDPATLAGETQVSTVPGGITFALAVSDSDAARAADAANRMCDAYVQRVTAQLQQERDSEVSNLEQKITQLQASIATIQQTPTGQRSPADNTFLQAQLSAVTADQQLLATTLALAPYDVAVLTRSPGGVRNDTRSLTRNVLVGGVAALLACFLVILVGEMAREPGIGRGG